MEKPYGPKFFLVIATLLSPFLLLPCLILWGEELRKPGGTDSGFVVVVVIWVLGALMSVALLVFWMVVAWRAMRAHERLARAGERAAAAIEELTRSRNPGSPSAE